jgi:hypothetical protein
MANHAIGAIGQAVACRSRNTANALMHDTDQGKIVTNCDEMKGANASHEPLGDAGSKPVAPASSGHMPMEEEEREIVGIVVRAGGILRHAELVEQVGLRTGVRNPGALVAGLLTSTGQNAYGRVFEEHNGVIRLHPAIERDVRSFDWE